ncbi:DUF11 domain-containing protein [Microbacterium sp. CPCC 204701]|uniref:DUF11 domain-containing protein n=1 Tax=Microbacterium sp. CPCC 204701 TaxID=2493084 RepID=UPI000FD848F0|nr:DUF11 domain-containing protein [Microbacterium sp. CPCC 204701]
MRRLLILLLALPALLLAVPAAPAAAAGAADDVAAVTVSVSDGRDDAAPGDHLDYTVEVDNAGAEAFTGSVTLRVPDFAEVEASGATIEGGVATWSVEIPAGGSAQWTATVIIGDESGEAYQVVVLAEVVDGGGAVVVRDADADAIPGSIAPPAVAGMGGEPQGLPEWVMPAAILAAVVLAGSSLALFGAVLARRGRPRRG